MQHTPFVKSTMTKIYELTGLQVDVSYQEDSYISFAAIDKTDAIKIALIETGHYAVELYPANERESVETLVFSELGAACTLFKTLHLYRTVCILPLLKRLTDNV